jgi:hypothetical protein
MDRRRAAPSKRTLRLRQRAGMTPDRAPGATLTSMDAIELSAAQQTAVRRMMEAVVARDETAVAGLLHRTNPENVYAAPVSNFWMWADDYADKALNLAMPPGEVDEWGVWGFALPGGAPGELALHAEVWADWGQTDLTIQFRLIPDGDDYRVELDDMHVM